MRDSDNVGHTPLCVTALTSRVSTMWPCTNVSDSSAITHVLHACCTSGSPASPQRSCTAHQVCPVLTCLPACNCSLNVNVHGTTAKIGLLTADLLGVHRTEPTVGSTSAPTSQTALQCDWDVYVSQAA